MAESIPLCVDMDGTLLRTDTLLESILVLLKRSPLALLQLPFWVLRGRATFKQEITRRAPLNAASLPLSPELVAHLRVEHQAGRRLLLVTGADKEIGLVVGEHLGLFEEVLGSNGTINLSGRHKAEFLVERFGKRGFDYAGNAPVDLAVWAEARKAIVVNGDQGLVRKAESVCEVDKVFPPPAAGLKTWLAALRVHQWTKNLLIFVPLLGAHQWSNIPKFGAAALAFLAFSVCSSSVYLLNDLFDLEADRHHPTKRRRPFASGHLPVLSGMIAAPVLLAISILIALALPLGFGITFAAYYILTFLYSLRLKQLELIDVLSLAALYSLRVLAGGYAAQVAVSDWLLVFSIFIFLSLAFVKRFTELQQVQRDNSFSIKGRGYRVSDLELISTMGVGSGYLAVLVLALYVTNPLVTELYRRPAALWLACPVLLYWISRVWLLAHRGLLHEDPIVFALKDKQSWLVCLLLLIVGAVAVPK